MRTQVPNTLTVSGPVSISGQGTHSTLHGPQHDLLSEGTWTEAGPRLSEYPGPRGWETAGLRTLTPWCWTLQPPEGSAERDVASGEGAVAGAVPDPVRGSVVPGWPHQPCSAGRERSQPPRRPSLATPEEGLPAEQTTALRPRGGARGRDEEP